MSKKGTSFWDLIKTILSFLFTKKQEQKEAEKIEAVKIEETLKEGYGKIDEEKEENKKENEDFDNAVDNLNDRF